MMADLQAEIEFAIFHSISERNRQISADLENSFHNLPTLTQKLLHRFSPDIYTI